MKALVTGGTGFLGRRLAERLLAEGSEVTIIGRNMTIGSELASNGARFIEADLRRKQGIVNACAGQDTVFHCGALSSPWGAYRDFYETNVVGTRHLIEGCRIHKVQKLIHVSTPSVYFDFTDRLNITESAPLPNRFANAYATTKRLAEMEVLQAMDQGLQALILRPRAIFGPGDNSILPRIIRANESRGVPMIDGGQAWMDLTYIDNAVDALILCHQAPDSAWGRIFNISNGEPVQLSNIVPLLFKMLDVPLRTKAVTYRAAYGLAAMLELAAHLRPGNHEPLLTRYTVGILGRSQTLDISAARQLLGYTPQVSVEEGLFAFAKVWRTPH
ncbi:Nucleoside-diphosphate-sugar epimerase [Paenibacillus sp. 1_12]|uniref:NAD-dependent epimerase/dehydratase family protein n=1 Tax=Paenibacillus sp. 1_12 TaxID=1566278 RepID=UPI0008E2C709|nr:NAD(P)-dependent oxidoreductase [Paenibacillus sp. 1_12]SFK90326.1 Nucleoside-diphosphate-sugar epimerase [Paenibacillus sp. 1_12]